MAGTGKFLTEEMRQNCVGIEAAPVVMEVEKGAIRRFAEAVGDPSPLWTDEALARKSHYGGIIAPPTFLRSLRIGRPKFPFSIPFARLLDGGSEWEYFEPVRVGDTITVRASIADVTERAGRLGTMLFIITDHVYTNQFGQVVATQRTTSILY